MSNSTNIFFPGMTYTQTDTVNAAGIEAFTRSLEENYLQLVMTNMFGNTYYSSKKEVFKDSCALHAEMLKKDHEFMAKACVYARNEGYMRLQPIFGLYHLSTVKPSYFEEAFMKIINTPNDLRDFMVIVKSQRNGEGGRRIKRIVAKWLNENFSYLDRAQYWAMKYGSDNKDGYSLRDIIRTVHPTPTYVSQHIFRYLVKGEAGDYLPRIEMFERFKKLAQEKDASIDELKDLIAKADIPREVLVSFIGKNTELWKEASRNMPIMALLKNLATLERYDAVIPDVIEGTLLNQERLERSKILPFRFLDAEQKVKSPYLSDVCKKALDMTLGNLPRLYGKSVIFLDISGSMNTNNIATAAIFSMGLWKANPYQIDFYLFNNQVHEWKISAVDSLLAQARAVPKGGGTDTPLTIGTLNYTKVKYDNIVIFTDEQATSSSFMEQFVKYLNNVNNKVKLFIVNVAAEKGHLAPDMKDVYQIYGLSDKVLQFISLKSNEDKDMIQHIKQISF